MSLDKVYSDKLNEAVVSTFSTVLSMDVAKVEQIDKGDENRVIISAIGLIGNVIGHIILEISADSGRVVVSKMLDKELEDFDSDIFDGVNELVNIITGSLKGLITEDEYKFDNCIPTVIIGSQMIIYNKDDGGAEIKFAYEGDGIQFEVGMDVRKNDQSEKDFTQEMRKSEVDATEQLKKLVDDKE